jgi:deoxyribodipyrimidine photo-lyase
MRNLVWFRHDLRVHDNTAFHAACAAGEVIPCVVLDDGLLKGNPLIGPNRSALFLRAVAALEKSLTSLGARLIIRHGNPEAEIVRLLRETHCGGVYVNRDYDPYSVARDALVEQSVCASGALFNTFKDLVIFEAHEVLTAAGRPYAVFSQYRKNWQDQEAKPAVLPVPKRIFFPADARSLNSIQISPDLILPESAVPVVDEEHGRKLLQEFIKDKIFDYANARDLMGVDGTSHLSPHLKYGTISPRTVFHQARELLKAALKPVTKRSINTFMSEIIWRDFFFQIMAAFPHVSEGAMRPQYDRLKWENNPELLAAWQEGRTGFPVVDAGMRQLKQTGWMHNRARMITASFLCKDLLIDWRLGERHFSRLLIDGEPAVNNGNWQWAAGTGADAQPWFRIFNPILQGKRFDADGAYVRRWIPELANVPTKFIHEPWKLRKKCTDYPEPIIDHATQRKRALALYKVAAK